MTVEGTTINGVNFDGPDGAPLQSACRLWCRVFNPEQTMETLVDHGVTARVRMREGVTPEILVEARDGVEIQPQDVTYCGGGGVLGTCATRGSARFPDRHPGENPPLRSVRHLRVSP